MPSTSQQNLETVMIDFFGALRRGDFSTAAELLRSRRHVAGAARRPGDGRQEVVDTFCSGLDKRREIDALEFVRGADRVVVAVRGPTLTEVAGEPLEGQIFNV